MGRANGAESFPPATGAVEHPAVFLGTGGRLDPAQAGARRSAAPPAQMLDDGDARGMPSRLAYVLRPWKPARAYRAESRMDRCSGRAKAPSSARGVAWGERTGPSTQRMCSKSCPCPTSSFRSLAVRSSLWTYGRCPGVRSSAISPRSPDRLRMLGDCGQKIVRLPESEFKPSPTCTSTFTLRRTRRAHPIAPQPAVHNGVDVPSDHESRRGLGLHRLR